MMPRRRTCLILQVKSSTLFDQNSPDQNEGPVLTNTLKTHANFRNLKIQFKVEKTSSRGGVEEFFVLLFWFGVGEGGVGEPLYFVIFALVELFIAFTIN